MKIIIIMLTLFLFSVVSQAQLRNNNYDISNSDLINEKGKNYIRTGLLNEVLGRGNAETGSAQHIESFYGTGDYIGNDSFLSNKSNTKGVILGTTSLLKKNDNNNKNKYITGVSLGYLDSNIKYENPSTKDKMKTFGGNIYFASLKENNVLLTHLGYTHSTGKDGDGRQNRNNLNFGIELGKVWVFNENIFIYPYISTEYMGSSREKNSQENYWYEEEKLNTGRANIGFYYVYDKNKTRLSLHTKYMNEIFEGNTQKVHKIDSLEKMNGLEREREYIMSSLSLGYYIAKDLLLSTEITGEFSKNNKNIIYGIKIAHTF